MFFNDNAKTKSFLELVFNKRVETDQIKQEKMLNSYWNCKFS